MLDNRKLGTDSAVRNQTLPCILSHRVKEDNLEGRRLIKSKLWIKSNASRQTKKRPLFTSKRCRGSESSYYSLNGETIIWKENNWRPIPDQPTLKKRDERVAGSNIRATYSR